MSETARAVAGVVRLVVAVAAVLALTAGCGSSGGGPGFSDPCHAQSGGGALCLDVPQTHGQVNDVIGYLSMTDSPLAGKRWRLTLSAYPCDPGTASAPSCRPAVIYPGEARRGVPPIEIFCKTSGGVTDTTSPGCHDTEAAFYASHGDWPSFPLKKSSGLSYSTNTWLCIAEQLRSGKSWIVPAPSNATTPIRECVEVKA